MTGRFIFCLGLFLTIGCITSHAEVKPPYFMSLKHDTVNLRAGPGNRYPIVWVYKQKNYPLEVVEEHELWRGIKERDGTRGWIHQAMMRKERYIIVKEEEKFYETERGEGERGIVQEGAIGRVIRCPKGSKFCLIGFKKEGEEIRGWMKKEYFYGVYAEEVID